MQIEHYFDAIYYGLNTVFVLCLLVVTVFSAHKTRTGSSPEVRDFGLGRCLVAGGTVLALLGGLFADAVLRDAGPFQQVRFGLYYVGFVCIASGTLRVARRARSPRWMSLCLILASVIALGAGISFLAVPSTFVLNRFHQQVQLLVYWLPLLVVSLAGSILLWMAAHAAKGASRSQLRLMAAFEALLFAGLLREAGIVPDLGDPLLNLLVSFVPFVAGGILFVVASWREERDTP